MCGRLALFTPPRRVAEAFAADLEEEVDPARRPRWNVAPGTSILAVGSAPEGGRALGLYEWGMAPVGRPGKVSRLINARAETVASRPTFRGALRTRRLVIPVDGFYEWGPGPGGRRGAFYFCAPRQGLVALAGIWSPAPGPEPSGPDDKGAPSERGRSERAPGDPAKSGSVAPPSPTRGRACAIVTTAANPDVAAVHDRMPAILDQAALAIWLDPSQEDPEVLAALIRPAPAGTLEHHLVDPRVGSVRNDDPGLVTPWPGPPGIPQDSGLS